MHHDAVPAGSDVAYPVELRSLLNPAFCTVVLSEFLKGYQSYMGAGAPYPLLFFDLPLSLSNTVRMKMNGCNAATGLHSWLIEHVEVKVDFSLVMGSLVPITKRAVLFALQREVFVFKENGLLKLENKGGMKQPTGWNDERKDILKKSLLLGKWFGQIQDSSTIFSLFGVRI